MVRDLPEDYFNQIRLECRRKNVSNLMSLRMLSLIPRKALETGASPVNVRNMTTVHFDCDLDTDTVQAILSRGAQQNLPVRYQFHNQKQLGAVLSDCSQLSHVCIDEWSSRGEALETSLVPFTESSLESVSICYRGHFQSNVLTGIVRNPNVKKLYVLIGFPEGWERFQQQGFADALSGYIHLKELVVGFSVFPTNTIRDGLRTLLAACGVTKSGSLHHLSVVKYPHRYDEWPHVELQPESGANDSSWDTSMSPALAMNWFKHEGGCFKEQTESSKHASEQDLRKDGASLSLLAWKLRAVNRGVVYRKTTLHAPHDMSTANASLLFAFLQGTLL
jgi:hypothetical protein